MLGGIGGLGGFQTYNIPQYTNIAEGMIGSPYASAYQDLSTQGQALGLGAAANAYGAGGNIYQQAFDPQQALYNQLYSQTTDAARANAMAAGLGTTPAGAFGTDVAQQNFNINWQNAQLQRMMQGGQAANALQGSALPQWMQAAGVPWQVGQTIGGANLGTLGQLGQFGTAATGIPQMQIGDWSTSIGQMGNLQNQAFNQAQAQYNAQLAQAQLEMQAQQQAAQQQSGVLGGLGRIGGAALGSFFGPAGMMLGSSLGGSLFGGGGGGGGGSIGWGSGGGSPYGSGGLPWSWSNLGGGGSPYGGGSTGGTQMAGNPYNVTGSFY
jgi:hypothetical protein